MILAQDELRSLISYYNPTFFSGTPNFNATDWELLDRGLIEVQSMPVNSSPACYVCLSTGGERALVSNASPSELFQLVKLCVAYGNAFRAAKLVPHIPVKFLPELLTSDSSLVSDAAVARLKELPNASTAECH